MTVYTFSVKEKGKSGKRDQFISIGKFADYEHFWKVFGDDGWYDRRTVRFGQDLSIRGDDPIEASIQVLEIGE